MLDHRLIWFRRLAESDLALVHHWLNTTPAVNEFYGDGRQWAYPEVVAKYLPRIRGEEPTTCYIITYEETPIGFIQSYLWRDHPSYAQYLDLAEESAGLDLFIGHPDYLHKGLGSHVLRAFVHDVIFADDRVQSCVITPDVRNAGAMKAYDKAGFQRLRVLDHPDEPGPVWVIRLGRVELLPRARYLTEPLEPGAGAPLRFEPEMVGRLPQAILAITGPIRRVSLPQQGVCNLMLRLEAERGEFALKVARAGYRSQELQAEHTVMQQLHGGRVPVPDSLLFHAQDELSYQLRAFSPGEPLRSVLNTDEAVRPTTIHQLGETLAAIHAIRPAGRWTWAEWVDGSLELAARNLAAGAFDPEEFTPEAPPSRVLEWLRSNRPEGGGKVCLLHGDYRPKNLLWQDGQITAVIDWAFADVGDPYYDLSIIRWYMRDEAEWEAFLAAYGLKQLDHQRFEYCLALHKFLNV